MKKKIFLLFSSAISFVYTHGQFAPGCIAFKDVTLIDGNSKNEFYHYTVLLRKDSILAVGPANRIVIPDSSMILNCSGKFLMPGLIDTHVHLATDPSKDDIRARAEKDLKAMLLSGITTVRDMAGDARALASLQRDAELDEIIAPDIYYAALMAGPGFFKDPRTHQTTAGGIAGEMPYMKAVTDSTDLRIAVAEAKGSGATALKLYADLSGALAKRITAEAHSQHLLVWSHANLTTASAREVIDADVNSISHAAMISGWYSGNVPAACLKQGLTTAFWDSVYHTLPVNELISALRLHRTILDATVLTYKIAGTDATMPPARRAAWMALYEIGKRFTKSAQEAGIPVCAGTDVDENKFVQREIKLLVNDCGFSPMEALISSTKNGARALGIEKISGTVEAGKVANLVLLSADPATEIDNLEKVELVIKHGKIYHAESQGYK